jgi:prevent-host-death family protein
MVLSAMATKPTETISISEFKATCLAVLERVRRTGTPIVVTRRGEPIAEVIPPPIPPATAGWLGAMRKSASITADLVAPAGEPADWDALQP